MIDLKKTSECIVFEIGEHRIPTTGADSTLLGEILRHESVERIADDPVGVVAGDWRISGVVDDGNERERDLAYRRILLWHGARKWHLTRKEAVVLGALFRTASSAV
jgi:hypothetical protein